MNVYIHCTQPPYAVAIKLLCPHHEGAGAPHPIRVGGPDLWYQMAFVDTTVDHQGTSACKVQGVCGIIIFFCLLRAIC